MIVSKLHIPSSFISQYEIFINTFFFRWHLSDGFGQEIGPKEFQISSKSHHVAITSSASQVDFARRGHSSLSPTGPSSPDIIVGCVPQQENSRALDDGEDVEEFYWREIQSSELISTSDYFSSKDEAGYKYCDQVTNVENKFGTCNVQMHSRFRFQDLKQKVKKKMAPRIIHEISHGEEEKLDNTGQELTPQDQLLTVHQFQDYPSSSSHGFSDAQKVENTKESTFELPLFDISLSPILDSSPVYESLSHSVSESQMNINVSQNVVTSENFLGNDDNDLINIKKNETCAKSIIDTHTCESAPVTQESVQNCHPAVEESVRVTDDAQKVRGCALDFEGNEECASFMQNNGKTEKINLNPETALDVGCDIGHSPVDEFVSRGITSRHNEFSDIPMISFFDDAGNDEVGEHQVGFTHSMEICKSNTNFNLEPEFASHVTSSLDSQAHPPREGEILNETVSLECGTTSKSEKTARSCLKESDKSDTDNQQDRSCPSSGKSLFKIPFRKIPESPIVSYPLNRKHITSTPKDLYQDKIKKKDFNKQSKGYSSCYKVATDVTSGKEREEFYIHPHSHKQGNHPSVEHLCLRPQTTTMKSDETLVSKKKVNFKQRCAQISSSFKIPSLSSEFTHKVRSECLQIANNATKIYSEEGQHSVEIDSKVTTHATFNSQALRKPDILKKTPFDNTNNSALKVSDVTVENVQNGTCIDITSFKVKGINTGYISVKEKLKKFSSLPVRVHDNTPDEMKRESRSHKLMSEEVADTDKENLKTAEKDSPHFHKMSEGMERKDCNISSSQVLHTGLKKRSDVQLSMEECWEWSKSKKRKTNNKKVELTKTKKKRKSFNRERVLLGEMDKKRMNKQNKVGEQKKEPKTKTRKVKLKKQEKRCEGKKSILERENNASLSGNEGKNTKKPRERKAVDLTEKMQSSSDVTQVS